MSPPANYLKCAAFSSTKMTSKDLARFQSKVSVQEDGCWIWTGCRLQSGYGQFRLGKMRPAHRVAYEHWVGQVPDELEMDHLCRVRACVNPSHVEPVTPRENLMRSPIAPAAVNSRKKVCKRGHEMGKQIPYFAKHGWRRCDTCWRSYIREYHKRRKQQELA